MEQTASRSKHPLEKLHHDAGEGIFNGTSPLSSISGSPPEFSPMDKAKWAAAAAAAISLSNAATAANTSVSLPSNLASAVTAKLVTGSAKRSLFSKTTDYEEEGDDEDEEDDDNDNDNEENGPPGHLGRPLSTSLSPGSSRAPHRANSSSPGKQNSMSPERSRMSMMDSSAHMPTQARSVSAGPSLGTLTSRSSSLSPPPNDEGGSDMSVDRVKRRRSASTGEDMLQSTANTSDAEVDGKKKDDDEMDENENEDEYNNERRTRRQIRARSARRPRSDNNKGTVHVPSNLLNPFKIMDKGITSKTSYSSFFYSPGEQSFKQAWMDEVMQDVNEISSEVKNLDKLSPGRRP